MAEKTDPKGWAEECVDSIDLKVSDAVRDMLAEQLAGVMQDRPLKAGEVGKLATALLEPPKAEEAAEQAA